MSKLATGVLIGLTAIGSAQAQSAATPTPASVPADPYLWLEDVGGDKQLAWVRERNAVAQKEIEGRAGFGALHARLKTILNSKERIPFVTKHGDYFYNFWKDAQHVRGIWRRTSLAQYGQANPQWETVIDLDQLAHDEQENWVWAGVACLPPAGERCLVSLSRGGGDAQVVREYDTAKRAFVADGFALPESKGSARWIDRDTLAVATDFGPGSMTTSGYPRQVKIWQRGTPLAQARLLYEG